jgi:hypothetical protein
MLIDYSLLLVELPLTHLILGHTNLIKDGILLRGGPQIIFCLIKVALKRFLLCCIL